MILGSFRRNNVEDLVVSSVSDSSVKCYETGYASKAVVPRLQLSIASMAVMEHWTLRDGWTLTSDMP
jgi:hypothetical protein